MENMENNQMVLPTGKYLSNVANASISFIRPAADLLFSFRGEQCNIEAVKLSATSITPLYRIFGMEKDVFVTLDEIFGRNIDVQQHTIDTLNLVKINDNLSAGNVKIQDDTLYFPVGSYVHLDFNQSFASDEVLYVKEIIISLSGVVYTLIDAMGNLIENIPSGVLTMKSNELNNRELRLLERQPTMIYRVDNIEVSDVDADADVAVNPEMPAEVAEMIKKLEGKTPEEAMALVAEMNNGLQPIIDGQAVEAIAIENGIVANEVSATLVENATVDSAKVECEATVEPIDLKQ